MTSESRPASHGLRIATAALTTWVAFFGTIAAMLTGMSWIVLLAVTLGVTTGFEVLEGPSTRFAWLGVGLFAVITGGITFVIARWQWNGMADSPARDHQRLLVVLVVLALAVAPVPMAFGML